MQFSLLLNTFTSEYIQVTLGLVSLFIAGINTDDTEKWL